MWSLSRGNGKGLSSLFLGGSGLLGGSDLLALGGVLKDVAPVGATWTEGGRDGLEWWTSSGE